MARDRARYAEGQFGLWLIAVRIDDKPGVGTTERDPPLITARFMEGVGVKR